MTLTFSLSEDLNENNRYYLLPVPLDASLETR